MTVEEKKIEIIGKIIDLKDSHLIDAVNEILNSAQSGQTRKAGWGKGMITYISEDFDDFIPPGFPVI